MFILFAISANDAGLPQVSPTSGTVGNVLKIVFGVAGALAGIFVAYGGFKYTISNGDPNAIQQAKNTILYALVGLVVSFAAFFIVTIVSGSV